MASQYAGWEIKGEKFFAMGSGPMRAAACREELFKDIGHCEKPDVCVGVLETSKLPPDSVCIDIAQKCGITPDRLTLLVGTHVKPGRHGADRRPQRGNGACTNCTCWASICNRIDAG